MTLSRLEEDLLGDLSRDTHGIWEVFQFVRLHHPDLGDEEVFLTGKTLLDNWIERGWIKLSAKPLHPSSVTSLTELQALLERVRSTAANYFENAPSIDLTEKAFADVDWL